MYTPLTSSCLYIINLMPDDTGIPSPAVLALSGWAMQTFTLA